MREDSDVLCIEHKKLNSKIDILNKQAPDGREVTILKQQRCGIKRIISRRAEAGDVVARAYAQERKWTSA